MSELCEMEIELLRDLNGEKTTITGWGSWMGECIEALQGHKLVDRKLSDGAIRYVINDAGKAYLASLSSGAPR